MYVIQCINKMKDRNHMIIFMDRGKAFDKIQNYFMIKIVKNWLRMSLNIIKAVYDKPTTNIIPNDKKLKLFF